MIAKNSRVVNIRYKVKGLRFDAAVDCDWSLHAYGFGKDTPKNETAVELYCFDHPEWDIRMVYHEEGNDRPSDGGFILHTCVDWGVIIKETRKWIKENGL